MNDNESIAKLSATLLNDPGIADEAKQKIQTAITEAQASKPPLDTDPWIYRMVVFFLGTVVLLTVFGGVLSGLKGAELPAGLIAIGSAAVGALAGLLAPPPAKT
jgi:hypothetical protein